MNGFLLRLSGLMLAVILSVAALGLLPESSWAGRVINDALVIRPFRHHIWQEVLSESVDAEGRVAFNRLRAHPRRLNQYLDQLAAVSPDSHPDFFVTEEDRMAYWINAYNALALRNILDYYPLDNLERYPGGIQGFRSRKRNLGGVPISLEALEDRLARAYYWKPVVFLALSDLTASAPPLLNQAYRPDVLDAQLRVQADAFINDPARVRLSSRCGPVRLSPVFRQFERPILRHVREEWPREKPSVLVFIRPWLPAQARGWLAAECERPIVFRAFNHRLRPAP